MTIEKESLERTRCEIPGVDRVSFDVGVCGATLRGCFYLATDRVISRNDRDVLIHHGHGEHSGRYRHVVEAFCRRGWGVWTYDMRGHGRSSGVRGDVNSYDELLMDLGAVLGRISREGRPFIMFGHSLGGQVVLSAVREWSQNRELKGAEHASEQCMGVVSASPYLQLAFSPQKWRLRLAQIASRICPSWRHRSPVQYTDLSSDPEHLCSLPGLDLIHDWISVRMFFEVEAAGKRLMEGGWRSKHPIFLAHGNADPVTSAEASRQFWDRLQVADGSASQFYEGMLHELWNERGREMFLGQILDWMDVRSARFFAGDRKSGSP